MRGDLTPSQVAFVLLILAIAVAASWALVHLDHRLNEHDADDWMDVADALQDEQVTRW